MKSLDKVDLKRRDELVETLDQSYQRLENAFTEYNNKVADLFAPVQTAIDEYNAIIADAEGFRDDVISQIDDYMSERSEKWLEGERGQAYGEWKDSWDNLSFEEIPIEQPDDLDLFTENSADALRDIEIEVAA
jgi:hypothetical protein